LVSLDIKTIFIVGVTLFGFASIFWQLASSIYLFRPPLEEREARRANKPVPSAMRHRLYVLLSMAALWLPFPLLFGFRRETIIAGILIGGMVALYAFFVFFLPLVFDREKPYSEKVEDAWYGESRDPAPPIMALDRLERIVGKPGVLAILLLILVVFYAYFVGRSAALRQDRFFVVNGTPPLAVLLVEDDKIVAAPFDRKCHALNGSIVVTSFGGRSLSMTEQDTGPLSPGGSC
jgi:hypothetical protein